MRLIAGEMTCRVTGKDSFEMAQIMPTVGCKRIPEQSSSVVKDKRSS